MKGCDVDHGDKLECVCRIYATSTGKTDNNCSSIRNMFITSKVSSAFTGLVISALKLNAEELTIVGRFIYLGSCFTKDGSMVNKEST